MLRVEKMREKKKEKVVFIRYRPTRGIEKFEEFAPPRRVRTHVVIAAFRLFFEEWLNKKKIPTSLCSVSNQKRADYDKFRFFSQHKHKFITSVF